MIGQDAQGDEPSHHVPYLYDYSGEPWKTQAIVREIMTELYSDKPDGLCGNDDCGQISAWYIFSAMGFYPVTPGQNTYAIGSPVFRKVSIELPRGKKFLIETQDNSDNSGFISSAKLNGKVYDKPFIAHENIIRGGTLHFVMSDQPNENWGLDTAGLFVMEPDHNIVKMPTAFSTGTVFYDSVQVNLECETPGAKIRYTLDGNEPGYNSPLYSGPVLINKGLTLKAFAYLNGMGEAPLCKRNSPGPNFRRLFINILSTASITAADRWHSWTADVEQKIFKMAHGRDLKKSISTLR